MKKTGLIILDGWGYREERENNAIALAHTPNFDELIKHSPNMLLEASGAAVGLPDKQMGNSEVGHLHIGAGRIVPQSLTVINQSASQDFSDKKQLVEKLRQCQKNNKELHIVGLLSEGGIHSHQEHLFAVIRLAKKISIDKLYIHIITDGRDTAPKCCLSSIERLEQLLEEIGIGKIASICGRFYAMDRDNRWQRTELAYRLIVHKEAEYYADNAQCGISQAYQDQQNDEFIKPISIDGGASPSPTDTLLLMNFRIDRMLQLTKAFINKNFQEFKTSSSFSEIITLTQYQPDYPVSVVFPPEYPENTFGEYIESLGMKQLRIAETEKYPHVTFFFNGGRNIQQANEQQILIPSPKVTTYDLQPEMSAKEVTNSLIKTMCEEPIDVFVCNFANADMVGHSGNLTATIQAVETVDQMLGEICTTAEQEDWQLIITADHGNADMMHNSETDQSHTAHTLSLVPLILFNKDEQIPFTKLKEKGGLIDIAPTMLSLMGQEIPAQMTGEPLFF
jgi:2,3-bisphosphoglycerate-independent phosphoglycerate mutase